MSSSNRKIQEKRSGDKDDGKYRDHRHRQTRYYAGREGDRNRQQSHSDKPLDKSSEQDRQADRDWYEAEEGSLAVDCTHNQYLEYGDAQTARLEARKVNDLQMHPLLSNRLQIPNKKFSARLQEKIRDTDKWEASRLQQGGLMSDRTGFDPSRDDDHQNGTVHLIVHERSPPFLVLDDKYVRPSDEFIRDASGIRIDPVNPVKDPTSDIAQMARRGSLLVKEMRERRERAKQMRSLEGQGTTLGEIMGKPDMVDEDSPNAKPGSFSGKFSDLLKPSATTEFATKRSLKEQRRFLPAFAAREQLLRLIRENRVVVVVGETGSGKTTQLAQYLDEYGLTRGGLMVGCTQPRRVAAVSVAKRVAEEMADGQDAQVGGVVGYAIRFEDCTSDQTRIKFMTDGVLLRETLRDPDLDAYSAVIIDEAHERSLQTDVILGLLKKIVQRRSDLRVIVTSATMDATRFSQFFADAPIFRIPGRTFPVDCLWAKAIPEDYVDASVKQVLTVHVSHPVGDILVFMTGQEDIEATCQALRERLENDLKDVAARHPLLVLPIYSQLPADLQAKIFEPAPEGTRKCIVATNIAETSLTVDGIRYVVDSGLGKVKVFSSRIGMDALTVAPVSQAAANQRAGRAGRTGPGVCFRLYPEPTFHHDLLPAAIPEIQRTNLSNVVLLLKSLGVSDPSSFDFIDAPPPAALQQALTALWTLGALNDAGDLTPLGRRMVEFPLDPPLSKMLLVADALGCIGDVLTIVSMLSVPTVFVRPKERADEADAAREKFVVPESDLLTLVNVYGQWCANGRRDGWCAANFIHARALQRADEVRQQLADILRQQRLPTVNADKQWTATQMWDAMRKCIAAAQVGKVARMHGIGQYANLRTGMPCALHPTSAIFGLGFSPEYVVYHELLMTTKEYMQGVTAVDPSWLAEAAPMLYSLRISSDQVGAGHTGVLLASASLFNAPVRRIVNFKDSPSLLRPGEVASSVSSESQPTAKSSPTENNVVLVGQKRPSQARRIVNADM